MQVSNERTWYTSPVVDPMKCIVRVANAVQMSERTTRRAFSMMSELLKKKTLTAGKDPMGLAASILYIASKETGETKNQMSMASAAGVTEVTIRNRIRALVKDLNLSKVNNTIKSPSRVLKGVTGRFSHDRQEG